LDFLDPNNRAGRNSTARSSAKTASSVMPISRNGSEMSQTNGKRIRASRARGPTQHKENAPADEQDQCFHRALVVILNGAKVNSRLGILVALHLVAFRLG
jgi:hypothetical protein